MLDEILAEAAKSDFDVEKFRSPDDPLVFLPDWNVTYRYKYAIAKVLQPTKILEIGVRFGYGARAFLEAVPEAKYVGIDNDSDAFGGKQGSYLYAKELLQDYNAKIIIDDSQALSSVKGKYDLVHVDGAQYEMAMVHDIEMVTPSTKYILVDGMFHNDTNHLILSNWLREGKYAWAAILPAASGELLLKVAE